MSFLKTINITKTAELEGISYLSGKACSTVGIKTPEIALYRIESHTPTIFTTVEEPSTGSI